MSRCTLLIGDRAVLESQGGPPEAEYALFDPGNIELHSDAPGTIREIGYRTTALDARRHLDECGITLALADEAATAMHPILARAYARGAIARQVSSLLGACELFEGKTYDAALRRYLGGWLDLQALAIDSKTLRATIVMQALHLAALLGERSDDTPVFLSTLEYTRTRRPGERSFRRVPLEHAAEFVASLKALAAAPSISNADRSAGPSRAELLESVSARSSGCGVPAARERLGALARALAVREPPPRGPLADAELWALETELSKGEPEAERATRVLEKLDVIEKARGRLPATMYLRARASLQAKAESPKVIAERMSALSQSMSSFFELELLAAQAWLAASDPRRAKAFARDLVENPNAPDELRVKALELLDGPARPLSVRTGPQSEPTMRIAPSKTVPIIADATAQQQQQRMEHEGEEEEAAPDTSIDPTPILAAGGSHERVDAQEQEQPTMRDRIPNALSRPPPPSPGQSGRSGQTTLSSAPPQGPHRQSASEPARPVTQPLSRPAAARPRRSEAPQTHARGNEDARSAPASAPPIEANRIVTIERPPQSERQAHAKEKKDKRGASQPIIDVVTAHVVEEPSAPVVHGQPPPPEAPRARRSEHPAYEGSPLAPRPPAGTPAPLAEYRQGASRPPFQTDAPPPQIPRAAPLPRERLQVRTELAESLSLPPGLHGQPPPRDEIPRTPIDARIAFTWLSRELGREYRARHRTELRTDVPSIEAMQRYLRERFADGQLKTPEDSFELRRHGAFLSEIIARCLGGYWVDVGPSELGYWAMIVGASTRVWPFGRLLRFVTMGHKERDLVSYYLELESRARS